MLNQQVIDLASSFNFLGMCQSFSIINQTDEGEKLSLRFILH